MPALVDARAALALCVPGNTIYHLYNAGGNCPNLPGTCFAFEATTSTTAGINSTVSYQAHRRHMLNHTINVCSGDH